MTDPTTPDPTPDPEPTPEPEPAPAGPQSFSQADVDRIVRERLKRESQKYEGYDEFKTKASELDAIRDGEKTELEKARERAEVLERETAEAKTLARESLLRAAVVAEAATRKVVDPEATVLLLDRSSLEYDENGAPTNVASAMDSLLEAKPYLLGGSRPAGSADLGARGGADGQLAREDLKNMSPEQIVEAQKAGRLSDMVGAP